MLRAGGLLNYSAKARSSLSYFVNGFDYVFNYTSKAVAMSSARAPPQIPGGLLKSSSTTSSVGTCATLNTRGSPQKRSGEGGAMKGKVIDTLLLYSIQNLTRRRRRPFGTVDCMIGAGDTSDVIRR